MTARLALVALCVLALGSASCGRYGPPQRSQPAGREPAVEIKQRGTPTPAPESPTPTREPEEEEPDPQ